MKSKKSIMKLIVMSLVLSISLYAAEEPKDASSFTKEKNAQVLKDLPFSDTQDFTDAKKGFIATTPELIIKNDKGEVVWDMKSYEYQMGTGVPVTVNPSLWRVAQINSLNGLFQVTDKVYQIRGFDISNMTIIEGTKGLIIIDPMISAETAKAGLDLYYKNRPQKPISAVIYSHSHVDHYGGVKGIVDEKDVKSGKVKVLAPSGFLEEAVKENVYAGNAMSRRSFYQYGSMLPRNPKGHVDTGLGKTVSSGGNVTLIPPTDIIKTTGEKRTIDGVQIEFLMAPNTEAPAEMLMYFPQFKLLNTAEDATHTLHNLYTLRGAQVRDAENWWKVLDEAVARYGDKTDVVIAQHHWPKWGNKEIVSYLSNQRDAYKYLNDQTLRLINKGYTMNEIAENLKLPQNLDQDWALRGYYGSVSHDIKAIYQRYLGWYDSNPANLNPLPPEESAKKYVEYMGGSAAVMKKAREAYNKGDYRWAAEVMNKVVFAEPNNTAAKNLQADILEQLGYQSENGTWRNEYLMGAYELRNGTPKITATTASPDTLNAMTPDMILDYFGIHIIGDKANGKKMVINWEEPNLKEKYVITLENSVLVYRKVNSFGNADLSMTIPKESLLGIAGNATTLDKEVQAGRAKVTGDTSKFNELLETFDSFTPDFNIVTP
ncbi:Metallo-beta-lactamase superfamily [Sebaldella termitidis]|uniref:Linear primary-alkylsulfatase n=1 Tax=Sebaldella termitidis (strain ATCC 33386 / NCTC 11300) TaxID=526218 RepID=D1AL19_SEBTE|nr:alkyl sulfatase dimerization domain-containing protein [Sebaldella termitidis]ACZ09162.1 beta-lactamase domain protein [Sebaldella termitidis ATCC 33386]SUI24480.1 Metallo-beta-lactamase superfamily [Sebaldella termitidis]